MTGSAVRPVGTVEPFAGAAGRRRPRARGVNRGAGVPRARPVRRGPLGLDQPLVGIATTATLSLVPFTVLLSYILRIVTVSKRTLSIGPFILRETDRVVDVEWD